MRRGVVRVVITGGGTGGHIFPGIALAEALARIAPGTEVLWIGARGKLEASLVPARGLSFRAVAAGGLIGTGPARMLLTLFILPVGMLQAIWHLARFRPRVVIGTGGYVAGPVVAAARLLRRRTAIHESNVTPGWTNRLLARWVDLVMVSYAQTERFFPGRRVVVTGNPVRVQAMATGAEERAPGSFHLLVLGGSQGARSLNRMTTQAVGLMRREGLEVRHQSGPADVEFVAGAYRQTGIEAQVLPFIDDMGAAYGWADLVVSRAGALTVAELAANARPAVLVPFPAAAEGHQDANAAEAVRAGGAVLIPDRGAQAGAELARVVDSLRADGERRVRMGLAFASLARPLADEEMARACLALAGAA